MKNSLIISLFFLTKSTAYSQLLDVRKANQQVAESILSVVNDCGNKIWPGYDLKNLNLVFIDETDENLVAVSTSQNRMFSLKKELVPANAFRATYATFKIENQRWMAINTLKISNSTTKVTFDGTVAKAYRLAMHEGFHMTTQRDWTTPDVRGTIIPIKWEPRLYRTMIYNNLLLALTKTEDNRTELSRARFWYDQWSQNFPEEVAITADGYEGTAAYVENLAETYRQVGCHLPSAEFQTALVKQLEEYSLELGVTDGYSFSLDGEGYAIGSLAAVLLHRQGDLSWYGKVAEGVTPLDQLLGTYQSSAEIVDDSYKNIFIETQKAEQERVDGHVGDTYKLLESSEVQYVSIPNEWRSPGSYVPFDFFVDPARNIILTPMFGEMEFAELASGSNLKSIQNAVYLEMETPCDFKNGWSVVVAKSEVLLAGNIYEIKNKFVNGTLAGAIKADQNGNSWLCAGE